MLIVVLKMHSIESLSFGDEKVINITTLVWY